MDPQNKENLHSRCEYWRLFNDEVELRLVVDAGEIGSHGNAFRLCVAVAEFVGAEEVAVSVAKQPTRRTDTCLPINGSQSTQHTHTREQEREKKIYLRAYQV